MEFDPVGIRRGVDRRSRKIRHERRWADDRFTGWPRRWHWPPSARGTGLEPVPGRGWAVVVVREGRVVGLRFSSRESGQSARRGDWRSNSRRRTCPRRYRLPQPGALRPPRAHTLAVQSSSCWSSAGCAGAWSPRCEIPNPRVDGRGFDRGCATAGIEVEVGLLEEDSAQRLNRALPPLPRERARPLVTLKAASCRWTACWLGRTGSSRWISGIARRDGSLTACVMRHDAVLVGAGTFGGTTRG